MVHQNSLANLQPPWEKGVSGSARSGREVQKAITKLRRSAPEAVDYCIALMNDPNENSALRLKAALAIIEKVFPGNRAADPALGINTAGIQSLRVEFVSGDQLHLSRQEEGAPSAAIEVAFEDVEDGRKYGSAEHPKSEAVDNAT